MPDSMPPTCVILLVRAVQELFRPCLKSLLEVASVVPAA